MSSGRLTRFGYRDALGQGRSGGEVRRRVAQVEVVDAPGGPRALADPAAADDGEALVVHGPDPGGAGRLEQVGVAHAGDRGERAGVGVPEPRLASLVGGPVAGVGPGVDHPPGLRGLEDRGVGREVAREVLALGEGVRRRVEDLGLAVEDLAGPVEAGHRQHAAVGHRRQRRVPAVERHVGDLRPGLADGVERVGLVGALVVLLAQGHLLALAVDVAREVGREPLDLVLRRCGGQGTGTGVDGLDEDRLLRRHHLRAATLAVLLRRREPRLGVGAVAHAGGRDEHRARRQHHRGVRVLVLHRHRAGRVRDRAVEPLVALGATRHEQPPVRQRRLPAAEHVVGDRDHPRLPGGRVVEQALERPRREHVLLVARPRDEQDLARGEQRGVDRVDPAVVRHVDRVPVPERALVVRTVDQLLVTPLVDVGERRGHVDAQQDDRAEDDEDDLADATGVRHTHRAGLLAGRRRGRARR